MGIYVKIEGSIAKGYEIEILKEVVQKLEKGEKSFTMKYVNGIGEIKVTTE